ncbi:uncharacterized protein LOC123556396 isoform X1 [Mercenaria mercenaria]|uniref:uncharacterized protein LOC123556396 isoform X1 n=1 Tax=Mercenaria mercenaria TaxID=6596 RepID=UPI00234F3657|nr:uncharacterized protein LOC123556396 isoform X1 [Mercenaria mercenaria]
MTSRLSGCSTSSVCFIIGGAVLLLGFIVHVVGFSIARWAIFYGTNNTGNNHNFGLWKRCICAPLNERDVCTCVSRSGDPAWFKVVQVMETLGLIGLICSWIISLVIVCYRQTKRIAIANIVLIVCSGVCILIGLVIFGVKNNKDFEDMFSIAEDKTLGVSFFLCGLAASICFCDLPLFLIGLRTLVPLANQQTCQESNESQTQTNYNVECHSQIYHQSANMHEHIGRPMAYINGQHETHRHIRRSPPYINGQHETHEHIGRPLPYINGQHETHEHLGRPPPYINEHEMPPRYTDVQHETPSANTYWQHETPLAYTYGQHETPPAYTDVQHETLSANTYRQHETPPAYTYGQHETPPTYTDVQQETPPANTYEQYEIPPAYINGQHEAPPAYTDVHHETPQANTYGQHETPPAYTNGQHQTPPTYTVVQHETPSANTYGQHETPPAYTYGQHETPQEYTYGQHETPPAYTS